MSRALLLSLVAALGLAGGTACSSAGAGADPAAGGLCETQPDDRSMVVVARWVSFSERTEDGISEGFDLDGRVSDDTDREGCRNRDYTAPDGTPGIDNQFAILFETLQGIFDDAVDGLVQGAINEGRLLLMIRVDGVSDFSADQCVNVSVFRGAGVPDIGTDGWIAPGQTFDRDIESPVRAGGGYIEDGVLHAGPFDAAIPINILQVFFLLEVEDALVRAEIGPDGSLVGMIGGGVKNERILEVARMAEMMQEQQLTPLLTPALAGLADLNPDDRGKCDTLSATLLFEGTQAFLFDDTEEFGAVSE